MKAPSSLRAANMTLENQRSRRIGNFENVSTMAENSNKICIFGTPLDNLMQTSPALAVPFVISRLCCYIEKHGLLQRGLFQEIEVVPGIVALKKEFDESGDASLEQKGNSPTAMKLLKLFFEELPEPLIPVSMHRAFFDFKEDILTFSDCIKHLKPLVDQLPDSVFCTLKYLSHFLQHIAKHEESNGLNMMNLSVIFGPIIFRPKKQDPMLGIMINITHCFVADYSAIFETADISTLNEHQHLVLSDSETSGKRRQVAPFPSSVGPVVPMQPLRVEIPPVDSTSMTRTTSDLNLNLPIFLIENHLGKKNDIGLQINIEEEIMKNEIKLALPGTRKRKEILLMTDVQASNDLVEKVPWSFSFEIKELSSDNEHVRMDHHMLHYLEKTTVNELSHPIQAPEKCVNSSSNDSAHVIKYEGSQSPHPPDPKRRELEFLDCRKNLLDEKYRTHHRNFIKYYNDVKPNSKRSSSSKVKKSTFERGHNIALGLVSKKDKCSPQNYSSNEELNKDCFIAIKSDLDKETTSDVLISENARPSSCPVPPKDDDCQVETDDSLSRSWSKLFETEEPVVSDHHLNWLTMKNAEEESEILSSSVHRFHRFNSDLDSSVAPSPPTEQEDFQKSPVKEDAFSIPVKQLTKKIHGLKKKIKRFDEKYEIEFGYKPSHAEKTNYPEAKKLLNDLHRARKDLKALKEDSHFLSDAPNHSSWQPSRNLHILEDTTNCVNDNNRLVSETLKKSKPSVQKSWGETLRSLNDERKLANRPELIEEMTKEQVKDEKLAIQKVLLHFESIHGKPSKKADRNTIRPLYERYRNIKRLLVKSNLFPLLSCKIAGLFNNLEPIMEHETMDFSTPQEEERLDECVEKNISYDSSDTSNQELVEDLDNTGPACLQLLDNKYNNSNLHELPLPQLILQQHQAHLEKRRMRRILREFEAEFMRINGRKIQKEDKAPVESLYEEYRLVKARLRLLDALISKHRQEHQNN